jgi:hypothetical protein
MPPDVDGELQERGLAVLDAAASTFGEKRFASSKIQQVPRPDPFGTIRRMLD